MIDLHAHVLPDIDDGPRSMTESLALIRTAGKLGIDKIAATPHVDLHYRVRPADIAVATAALRLRVAEAGIDVNVATGAEIALDRLIDLDAEDLDRLGLGGGRCLLVEPPLRQMGGEFEWPIEALLADDERRVLLAHPERCPAFQSDLSRLSRLVDQGAMCQVTTGALLGDFGRTVQATALSIFDAGLVHNVASDMHDVARRPPSLHHGVELLIADGVVSAEQSVWLTETVPAALLADARLPPRPGT